MKKTKLGTFFTCSLVLLAFATNAQTIKQTQGNTNPTQSQPVHIGNTPNVRPINSSLEEKTINSTLQQNQSINSEFCKTYELNQKHYQERGLQQQFNTEYMQTAQSMASYNAPKTSGVNEISIIFHVVHNPNNPAENVSNAAIMQVYNDIVEDYQLLNADAANVRPGFGFTPANANINFCLATQDPFGTPLAEPGIIRVSTTEDFYDSNNGEENKMKSSATGGSDSWDRNNYLNVWICDITNGASSGTAGYAYRPSPSYLPSPGIDGIVIDYNLGVNNDNVLTHEISHYLGIDHTWGGSGSCTSDDGFSDTPNTIGPADNQPGFYCGIPNFQTCGVEVQYENYMDYATGCSAMFSQEQADYMLMILQGIRGSLLLSPGCNPTNTPPNSAFTTVPAGPSTIPQNASVSFFDQSTNAPNAWAWTISGVEGVDWAWVNTTNQNSQNPTAEFYSTGAYDITLTASNGFGSDPTPASETAYVNVVAASTGNSCDTLRNWDPVDISTNGFTYYNSGSSNGSWGYIPGHNELDIYGDGSSMENTLQYAEQFSFAGTAQVRAVELPLFIVENNSLTGSVEFIIYDNDNGANPGSVLASEVVDMNNLTAGSWNNIEFTTPASVTGTFFAGFRLNYSPTQDTILVGMSGTTISGGNDSYFMELDTYGWVNGSLLGITGSMALDVLLSNGTEPNMNFTSSPLEICDGGEVLVDGSASTDNNDYNWFVTNDPWTNTLESSNSSSNTFTFSYGSGTYNIYLFGNASCVTRGVYAPVTVNPAVSATVSTTATTCGNNNGTIVITAPSGGDGTYYYSLDGVNFQTSNSFTNLPAGSYDVYYGTNGSGCVTMETVSVGSSTPYEATAGPNSSICPGGSSMVTASGGDTYQWFDGATQIATTASTSVSPSATTQYSCIVTDGTGCQSTVYVTVTVNPTPTAPTISASGSTTICAGGSVDLTSSYSSNIVWSTSETSTSISVGTAGSYTVTYTDGNGCTSTSSVTTVNVNPTPTITTGTVNDPTSCSSATGSIQVTGTGTGDVSWSGSATGSATGVTLPYVVPNLTAGSYNILFTDGIGCSSNTINVALNDPTPPTTPTVTASGPVTFCQGNDVTLTSSAGTGITWSNGETTPSITVSTSGNYSVTYTDGSGCSASSTSTSVTVNNNPAAPTITPSGATTFCDGQSVTLSSSQGSGNLWSTGESTQLINATTTGSYTVTYTNANGCEATSAPVTVTVNTLPNVDAGIDQEVCEGESVTLSGSGAASYTWDNSVINNSPFTPTSGTITYTVTGTGSNGCTNTDAVTVVVNALPTVTFNSIGTVCDYNAAFALTEASPSGGVYSGNGVISGDFDPATAGVGTHTITYTYTDGNGCEGTSTQTITVDGCASINENNTITAKVYPNPLKNQLGIELEGNFNYEILDTKGRVVSVGTASDNVIIHTTDFNSGMYFVTVKNEKISSTTRVVKH